MKKNMPRRSKNGNYIENDTGIKTERVEVRLTKAEKDHLQKNAKENNCSISKYLLDQVFQKE